MALSTTRTLIIGAASLLGFGTLAIPKWALERSEVSYTGGLTDTVVTRPYSLYVTEYASPLRLSLYKMQGGKPVRRWRFAAQDPCLVSWRNIGPGRYTYRLEDARLDSLLHRGQIEVRP